MTERIQANLHNQVYTITLNRPEKHNCIGWDMLHGLEKMITEAESNPEIKVVAIQGAGDRSFSSGADLKEFSTLDPAGERAWIMQGNKLFNRLEMLPKPTIAVLKGYVIGGGLELALCCDFRISSETALLSFPEVSHGWLPGWGGMTRLQRIAGPALAKKMILLGDKLEARAAYEAGLITRLIASTELEQTVNEVSRQLKDLNPIVYEMAKAALQDHSRTTSGADLLFDVMALRGKDLK